jgi:hypothetical protein
MQYVCLSAHVCVSLHKHWHIFAEEMFAKGFRAILGCETVTLLGAHICLWRDRSQAEARDSKAKTTYPNP